MIVMWGTQLTFGVFFEPVLTEFGWTRAETSGAYSLCMIVIGLLGIGVGRLTDRFGPRIVMTVCGSFLGLGYLLMSQIGAMWHLYLFFGVLIGTGMAGAFVPLVSTVARWFVKRRALMTGVVSNGISIGSIIMPPLARWLISTYGWRTSYIIVGTLVLVITILAAQFLRRDPSQVGQLPYGENEVTKDSSNLEASGFSLREAIHTRQFWILCAVFACILFPVACITVHIVIHATGLGISVASAAYIFAFLGVGGIAGRVILGAVADRVGNKLAIIFGFILMSAALFWLLVGKEVWMLYLFGVVHGFAYTALIALMSPMVAELFGLGSHGAILGVVAFGGSIGEASGPVLAGRIFDMIGSYHLAFLVCAALGVSGGILTALLSPVSKEGRGKSILG